MNIYVGSTYHQQIPANEAERVTSFYDLSRDTVTYGNGVVEINQYDTDSG